MADSGGVGTVSVRTAVFCLWCEGRRSCGGSMKQMCGKACRAGEWKRRFDILNEAGVKRLHCTVLY